MSVWFNENEWRFRENQKDNFPLSVYSAESFIWIDALYKGNYVNALSNCHGQPFCRESVIDYLENFHAAKSHFNSFELAVNGRRLRDKFVFERQYIEKGERGGELHCVVISDSDAGVRVHVKTFLDGSAFIVRWLEIENIGRKAFAVTDVFPMCGVLYRDVTASGFVGEELRPKSFIGYFEDNYYLGEGIFKWAELPKATLSFRHERGLFNPPTYFLKDENSCQVTIVSIETSTMPRFEATKCGDPLWSRSFSSYDYVHFKAGIDQCALPRTVSPGEKIVSPKIHIGQVYGDTDDASNAFFKHIRKSVIPRRSQPVRHPFIYTHGAYSGCCQQNVHMLKKSVDLAVETGAELFLVDAGWFGSKNGAWYLQRGDWSETESLNGGLNEVFDYARKRGLMCGLWMEAEGCDFTSELYKQHPEWVLNAYGKKLPVLNLCKKEVENFVYDSICNIIEKYKLDLFRIDGGLKEPSEEYTENGYEGTSWKYYEVLYDIFERIRKKYPSLYLENCSGGGGRADLGIMGRFDWIQATDLFAPATQIRVFYGLSRAMCPEQLLSIPDLSHECEPSFLARSTIFGHIETTDTSDDASRMNPNVKRAWRKAIGLYKKHIRTIIDEAEVFHHHPETDDYKKRVGAVIIEYALPDKSKSIIGIFKLNGLSDEFVITPRGISASCRYSVYSDNDETSYETNGSDILEKGLKTHIIGQKTSEVLVLERIE